MQLDLVESTVCTYDKGVLAKLFTWVEVQSNESIVVYLDMQQQCIQMFVALLLLSYDVRAWLLVLMKSFRFT